MTLRSGELDDLILDRRTVAWTARCDRPTVHRRLTDVSLDDRLPFSAEESDPAGKLGRMTRRPVRATASIGPEVRPGIVELLDLTLLLCQRIPPYGATVDPGRRTRLEARHFQSRMLELLREVDRRRP